MSVTLSLLFLCSLGFASQDIQAILVDPSLKAQDLGLKEGHVTRTRMIPVPGPKLRNKLFSRAGLVNEINSLDEEQKKRLFSMAGLLPVDRLCEIFPSIPRAKLTSLRVLVLRSSK